MDNQYNELLIRWEIDPEKGAWEICRELTRKRNECRERVSSKNSEAENLEYTKQAEELKKALAFYQELLDNSNEKEREIPASDGFDTSKFKKKHPEKKEGVKTGKDATPYVSDRFSRERYDAADASLKASDHEKGLEELRRFAEEDQADAQNQLGLAYSSGKGAAQDLEKAVYWYGKAANQGDKHGQYNLARAYSDGKGVARDLEKAAYWYEKSAEQGDKFEQFFLGRAYETGDGVEKNLKKAAYWYEKAASKGHNGAKESYERLMQSVNPSPAVQKKKKIIIINKIERPNK